MRKALLLAVDRYQDREWLHCVEDAAELETLLERDFRRDRQWTARRPTQELSAPEAQAMIHEFLLPGAEGQDLLLYFAGHGSDDGYRLGLVFGDESVLSFGDVMGMVNNSRASTVTVVLDCCFAGMAGNDPRRSRPTGKLPDPPSFDGVTLGRGVTLMAACQQGEVALESERGGVFTRALIEGLKGGASDHRGRVTTLGLYAFAADSFAGRGQTPVLKTNLSAPLLLQRTAPWIDDDLLRRLPDFFDTAQSRIQMTKAHEGSGRAERLGADFGPDEGTPEQREFDYLNHLRRVNLVTNDRNGMPHFWLTEHGGEVFLTPLGQYFWRLAADGAL